MARRRLPGPIFHYIGGAADDEVTYRRNTEAYERCDLVPNILAGVENIDMSTTVMGQKIGMPLFCAPTALQRLFVSLLSFLAPCSRFRDYGMTTDAPNSHCET